MSTSISSTIKTYPRLPYQKIAAAILGPTYDLSLVFIGRDRAKTLNQTSRGKSYVPNVLSFPLTDTAGEIYIAPTTAETESKAFDLTPRGYVGFLFIHGCLHLKGLDHGPQMEKLETQYLQQFGLK